MKKAVIASLLAVAPCFATVVAFSAPAIAQQVTMDPAEYNAYQLATGVQDPTAKSAALEGFLTSYPNTKVKAAVLDLLVISYQQAKNLPKAVDAAKRSVAMDPNNLRALVTITAVDRASALQKNPPDQAMLDEAAGAAQKGLAATAPSDPAAAGDFTKMQTAFKPIFEDAIGVDDVNKKQYDDGITALKAALAAYPPDQANQGSALQDTYLLGQAYASKGDALTAAYYFARVSALAPSFTEAAKSAAYWYKKYHGKDDGYDAFKTAAASSPNPPANLASTVTPAPKPEDIANQTVASTPDLASLSMDDREFILASASQENADKTFAAVKGKPTEVQGTVVSATPDEVQLSVGEDAVASKTADATIKMAKAMATPPAVGSQQTYVGTYDAYTKSPFMLSFVDGKPAEKAAKPAPKAPVRRRR